MKLTESKLREIIQEELTSLNEASISDDLLSRISELKFGKKIMGSPSSYGEANTNDLGYGEGKSAKDVASFILTTLGYKVDLKSIERGGIVIRFPDVNISFNKGFNGTDTISIYGDKGAQKNIKSSSFKISDNSDRASAVIAWISYNKDILLSLASSKTNKDIKSLMTTLNFKLSKISYGALDNINAFLLSEIQGVGEHGKGNSKMKEAMSILNKFSKMKDFTNPSDDLVKEVKDGKYKR
jgi:hypothetical protein